MRVKLIFIILIWFPRKSKVLLFTFLSLASSPSFYRMKKSSAAKTNKFYQNSNSNSNSSRESLAFHKTSDPSKIYFPKQDVYYVYRPAPSNANIFARLRAFVSLYYYKYLLHSGLYVMTRSEQFVINSFVIIGILLSCYQAHLILKSFLITS